MSRCYRHLLSPLSAFILLTGCAAVGPDYSPPDVHIPASFGETAPGLDSGEVQVEWWRGLDEPALVSLIQRALAANHDIALAAVRLEEAKALLRGSRQEFLPRGGPAYGYQTQRRGEVETPAGQQREIETYRGALDASWEIDLFGRVRRSVEAAEAQAGSREALLRSVQESVAATVVATWFELQGIEAELAVVNDIRQNQRDSLEMVERLVSAGSAHEFDRLRAEALLRNVEAAVPELEQRRAASTNALAILLADTPQTFRPPAAGSSHETLKVRTIGVGDPAGLLSRRADIAAAERNLAAATARIGVETAGLYPQIQVQGSIGLVAGDLDALDDGGATFNFLSPVIRWAVLDRGRVRAQIAASEARAQEALILYDQTVLRALQETDDAFKRYGAAGDALRLRLLESAANREAAHLARERFIQGDGQYLDVLEAERSDYLSRRALTIARTTQRLAIVSIYKALGGGWETCAGLDQRCHVADGNDHLPLAQQVGDRS
ncbi:efflux transporter outer membrane subunit [Pseudomonas jinjuensis]|uniref:Outer membrane protein, multidrug efflux system n=1 Tax=Pseudomonas jinjuensis TaxID=198616 RepID=A0A1H0JKT4_9PSED|nr:TolC family protein [Pseudomonas jinjuensis]SDO44397.1 outer membrane protein, multidrug efflux system [Pseudomonas jinjuensis]